MTDKIKLAVAVLFVVAGLAGYYLLADKPAVARVGAVLAGLAAGVVVAWFSESGKQFLGFAQESWAEAKRVVWPTRKETVQTTLVVFGLVVVLALFIFGVDMAIEFTLYDLILGIKK
jgi:preprotein translocase subunit SecE